MTVRQKISAQKNTTPMGPKLDESVEIRLKSPDVNLETGVDVSVVGNNLHGTIVSLVVSITLIVAANGNPFSEAQQSRQCE